MKSAFIAIPAILANLALAAPVEKRAMAYTAVTVEDYTTVAITTTVYVDANPSAQPALPSVEHSASVPLSPTEASTTAAAVTSAPAPPPTPSTPSTTSSVYVPPPSPVAPAPTSSSVSVASVPVSSAAPVPSAAPASSAAPAPSAAPVASGTSANFPASADITVWTPPNTFPEITSGIAKPGSTFTGKATYYAVGLGSCGWSNTQTDNIVALQEELFDQYTPTSGLHAGNTNMNTVCGKPISISHNGKSYPAVIADRCPGCSANGLDLSQNLFEAVIGSTSIGVSDITWSFV